MRDVTPLYVPVNMAASLPAASGCKNQRIFLNQQYKYLIVALPEERLFAKKIVFPANLVCIIQIMFGQLRDIV